MMCPPPAEKKMWLKLLLILLGIQLSHGCVTYSNIAFCSDLCTQSHYYKGIVRIEVNEPNEGDPYAVKLDCLMYFPQVKVLEVSFPLFCLCSFTYH
jgi:hypothetical protein